MCVCSMTQAECTFYTTVNYTESPFMYTHICMCILHNPEHHIRESGKGRAHSDDLKRNIDSKVLHGEQKKGRRNAMQHIM